MNIKDLQETQELVKKEVEEGRMTKQEAISACCKKAIEILQSLKVPEEQFMLEQTMHGKSIN